MVGNGEKSYDVPSGAPTDVDIEYQSDDGGASERFPDQFGDEQVIHVGQSYDPETFASELKNSEQFSQEDAPNTPRIFVSDEAVVYVGDDNVRYAQKDGSEANPEEALGHFSGLFEESESPLEEDVSEKAQNSKAGRKSKFGGGSPFERSYE